MSDQQRSAKSRGSTSAAPPSGVEQAALARSGHEFLYGPAERIPSIVVPNFPALGRLTAARFLEWVRENPEGVVSLPTGKTPEHFIKYVQHYLRTWGRKETAQALEALGLPTDRRPELSGLRFVQMDEFYPIDSKQHNSFYHYVCRFYLKGFGLERTRALLIDPLKIGLPKGTALYDVFPDGTVDLSLRIRRVTSVLERRQQEVLRAVDAFCTDYERRIRELGGIGFFLGGIGPDGHIAFNIRGSDRFSTTRLLDPNYETKAAAATDLGGMEVARHKSVITIGLSTITYNREAVALIFAAGEAKARIVARTIHSELGNEHPGSVLSLLPHARFYLTTGAASRLTHRLFVDLTRQEQVPDEQACRIVMDLSLATGKPIRFLTREDFQEDRFAAELLKKTQSAPQPLKERTEQRVLENLHRGHAPVENKTLLHTSPHHDDIILAYLPYVTNAVRRRSTRHCFAYLTSGFNAVTNSYMYSVVVDLQERLRREDFRKLFTPEFFEADNVLARRIDTSHYFQGVARHLDEHRQEAAAQRLLRNLIELYEDDNLDNIQQRLTELANYFHTQYPGKKDMPLVQQLKGRMREWESDLKWAYYGFTGEAVRHLRLGFYRGDIFTETPTLDRDVPPIRDLLREIKPDIVTVAFDPEGTGPDTHYKALQAVSAALRLYEQETERHDVRVLGYRNVWYKFHPAEANLYVPTSLTHMNDLEVCFDTCFVTQRSASFPSHEYDGPFSKLARKIQARQYEQIKTFLGEDFFVYNADHGLRAACGMVYLREMDLAEFYTKSAELKQLAEEA
ncbi:MAG: glucosamine-6-phosphate deaminase [Planctomycetota bacterium]